MRHGDFTELAEYYGSRPGYSKEVLMMIKKYVDNYFNDQIIIADVGAGTGKLTEGLLEIGCNGFAIEPNDAMRYKGISNFKGTNQFKWLKGSAECTGLEDNSVNWILMGSSFHWVNLEESLCEFSRILKKGGYFTAIWNPRCLGENNINDIAEEIIHKELPHIKRVSSGNTYEVKDIFEKLCSNGLFDNPIYCEGYHYEVMEKQRYMDIWKSVNDIRVQGGENSFNRIISAIDKEIKENERLAIKYRTRAWTVKVTK